MTQRTRRFATIDRPRVLARRALRATARSRESPREKERKKKEQQNKHRSRPPAQSLFDAGVNSPLEFSTIMQIEFSCRKKLAVPVASAAPAPSTLSIDVRTCVRARACGGGGGRRIPARARGNRSAPFAHGLFAYVNFAILFAPSISRKI